MIGFVENNYRAIIKPKKDIENGGFYLIPELEYQIARQEEPIDNPDGLKRTFIQGGGGIGVWFGYRIEEYFDIIKVLRERNIKEEDLKQAIKYAKENGFYSSEELKPNFDKKINETSEKILNKLRNMKTDLKEIKRL